MKRKIQRLSLGLAAFLAAVNLSAAATNAAVRVVSADWQQTNGPLNTMFKFCVGAGRANEGLRADWQRQLTVAHRECGFEYIRMHGLFTDDMGVYRDYNGNPNFMVANISVNHSWHRQFLFLGRPQIPTVQFEQQFPFRCRRSVPLHFDGTRFARQQ